MSSFINRVIRSTISNYIGKFVKLGAGFLLTPFILHQLGETIYGLWILVGSVTAYGSLLDFGIASAVTKYVAEYRAGGQIERLQSLVATALALYSILGLALFAGIIILAPIFPDLFNIPSDQRMTAVWLVTITGSGVALSIPFACAPAVLHGFQRYDLTNLISTIGIAISASGTVIVLMLGGGVIGIAFVGIAVMLVTQIASIWSIYRISPDLRFSFRGAKQHLARKVASFSTSVFLINLGGQLETQTDEMVIGVFMPVNAIAPYHIARKLSEIPQVITVQFARVLLPLASELESQKDTHRLRLLYVVSSRLTLGIFLPIACVLIIFAKPILAAWVGPEYGSYANLVIILTIAGLIDTSQWPAGFQLQGMAKHRPLAVLSVFSGVANLVISVVLVRAVGLTGVALGTLLPTTIIISGFVIPYAIKAIGVGMHEVIVGVLLPALIPALPTALLLIILKVIYQPSSFLILMAFAAIGLVVYTIGYLGMSACEIERETIRILAKRGVRLVKLTWIRLI